MLTARDAKDARKKQELEGGNHRGTVDLSPRKHRRKLLALNCFLYWISPGVLGVLRSEGFFVAGLDFRERA